MNLEQAAEKAYDAALPFKWSDLNPKTRAVWVAFLAAAVAELAAQPATVSWGGLLSVPKREGFHRHWVNDMDGRLERFVGLGMRPVIDEAGHVVRRPIGTGRHHQPLYAQLLEIETDRWAIIQTAMRDI